MSNQKSGTVVVRARWFPNAARFLLFALAGGHACVAGPIVCSKNGAVDSPAASLAVSALRQAARDLGDQPADRYHTFRYTSLPADVRTDLDYSLRGYMPEEAWPQNARDVAVRVYLGRTRTEPDLVEYRWTFAEHRLRVVIGANAYKVEIPLVSTTADGRLREAKKMFAALSMGPLTSDEDGPVTVLMPGGARVLKPRRVEHVPSERVFPPWPDVLSDGFRCSSNPRRDIIEVSAGGVLPYHWGVRVDLEYRAGVFRIFRFRYEPERAMCHPLDWIGDEFGAAVRRAMTNP